MISSQCINRHTSLHSCVFVIMIVAKVLLLFPPLLLLANAQGGGRMGFFARPDFRRLRPWQRPTVAPVPDTPMPTEKVTESITDSPNARTEVPRISPVRPTSGAPVYSVPRPSPRGRVWARPVFQGTRPTPAAVTSTESITTKPDNYSPVASLASSTSEPKVYIVTPSTQVPFVDNHAQYKDPNNFNPRGRYSPKLTHNNEEIQSDSIKTTTELPIATEKITELITEQTTPTSEGHSTMVSSTSTTTESVKYTVAPTTAVPFINSPIKYNESLNNNLDIHYPSQATLHLNEQTTELKTTPEPSTTPRVTFIPTRTTNFNSMSRFPPYMSHVPTASSRPQYIPDDYLKTSSTTIAATTELPSSTTESAGYTVAPSINVPFVDEHKRYDDIYLTTKTPIPFKIISSTEVSSATTNHHNSIYQVNQNDGNKISSNSELYLTMTPKAVTMPTTEPEDYIRSSATEAPLINEHEEFNVFTSHSSEEYTNGHEKPSVVPSNSHSYNPMLHPVYHHDTSKVSHYEQSSSGTREPEIHTVTSTARSPFIDLHKLYDVSFTSGPAPEIHTVTSTARSPSIDLHKLYDVSFTSGPAVEYTNGHAKTTEIPSSDGSKEFHNIYQNNNNKVNDYEHSSTPKVVTTTESASAYQFRYPKTTMEPAVVTQTVHHTNSFRYNIMGTKPTTGYTTTTARSPRLNKIYDIENFKCKDEDAYYSISNQCDDFIECKAGYPIQNTCPDGLHFNPAAKYAEFPCAYPSEVKCESNSVIRQPEPTSQCPRRYGYFSLQDGRCDKYIMCQEGQATIMSCPAGLAFNEATSSCDWPSNVPDCLPDAFQGFTCPTPELDEDGQPIHSIYKYRYAKSCKKYIACQKGHPRLLSCDSGLAFDENSESCINELDVTDCT